MTKYQYLRKVHHSTKWMQVSCSNILVSVGVLHYMNASFCSFSINLGFPWQLHQPKYWSLRFTWQTLLIRLPWTLAERRSCWKTWIISLVKLLQSPISATDKRLNQVLLKTISHYFSWEPITRCHQQWVHHNIMWGGPEGLWKITVSYLFSVMHKGFAGGSFH